MLLFDCRLSRTPVASGNLLEFCRSLWKNVHMVPDYTSWCERQWITGNLTKIIITQ